MYNITGWSGGGRRPLSYNLMPGQFRNTRVNVFSNPTIINNNIGGFGGCYDYYDDCCCGGGNKMSWMDWTMMGGMLLNGLGNMFACFWGGGGGGAEKAKADTPDDKTLKTQAKELAEVYGVDKKNVSVIDGTIRVNIDGQVIKCEDLEELEEALSGGNNDAGAALRNGTRVAAGQEATTASGYLTKIGLEGTVTFANGKYTLTVNGTPHEYNSYEDFIIGANELKNPPAAVREEAPVNTGLGEAWANKSFTNFDVTGLFDDLTSTLQMTDKNDTHVNDGLGTNVKAPKSIKVTKGGKTYLFELIDNADQVKNGNPVYKCTKIDNISLKDNQIQEYILTPDGKFVQATDSLGYGYNLGDNIKTPNMNLAGNGYQTRKYNATNDTTLGIKLDMTVDDVLTKTITGFENKSDTDKNKLRKALIQANPNGIVRGKVVDLNKLHLITPQAT